MAEQAKQAYSLIYKGFLKGHNGWVTSMQLGFREGFGTFLVSSARDKSLLIWKLKPESTEDEELGRPYKLLHGHSHFVQEVSLSNDCTHCLTAGWDGLIRMWDINECKSSRIFKGHTKDVLSVAFSPDNRQIISGGRDKTIRLWNILGENKYTIESAHNDWVSTVRFSPDAKQNLVFSAGWDRKVKIWDKTKMSEFAPEPGMTFSSNYLNTLAIAPAGTFVSAGGKEGVLRIWSVDSKPDSSYSLKLARTCDLKSDINAMAFSPKLFWVAAGCNDGIHLYDFKQSVMFASLTMQALDVTQKDEDEEAEKTAPKNNKKIGVTSLCMNNTGNLIFAGCTDNIIRVFEVKENTA